MLDIPVITTVWYVVEWLLRIAALFVVPRNRKPSSGMAWLMAIFLLPIPGWIVFLILGTNKLPKWRRDAQKTLNHYIAEGLDAIKKTHQRSHAIIDASPPKKYKAIAELSESLTRLPVFSENTITLHTDYNDTFVHIIKDIDAAKHFVYLEYYIMALDKDTEPIISALEAAVRRGVVVRVLYDAYGSHAYPQFRIMKRRLRESGIILQSSLPLTLPGKNYTRPDLRNHRKLIVVDSYIGYTGSQNIIARDYHRKDGIIYDELVVRVVGPVASQLEAVFLTDWYAETKEFLRDPHPDIKDIYHSPQENILAQLVPSGPGYDDENNLKLFTSLIYRAATSIVIVNPYFVPDESLMMAIIAAARRGVRVTLINSEVFDQRIVAHAQRSYYEKLLEAGVEIYLHKAPTLVHSKFIVIDDDLAVIGSSNMDIRSFELNHELTLIAYNDDIAKQMTRIASDYREASSRVSLREWQARRGYERLLDNLARLTSSLQ